MYIFEQRFPILYSSNKKKNMNSIFRFLELCMYRQGILYMQMTDVTLHIFSAKRKIYVRIHLNYDTKNKAK